MRKVLYICVSLLALMANSVSAQQSANEKILALEVVWVPSSNSEVFVVEGMMFESVASLKKFLVKQEAGTVVLWDPGCFRIGDRPLLSSAKELKEFKQFLEKRRMKLVMP